MTPWQWKDNRQVTFLAQLSTLCRTEALCDIIGYGYFLPCICRSSTYGLCHASPAVLAFNLSAKEVSIFTLGLVSRRNWFGYHFLARLVRVCQSPVFFFFPPPSQVISHEPVRSCGCWIINSKCMWFLILYCGHRVILRAEHDTALTTEWEPYFREPNNVVANRLGTFSREDLI